MDQKRIRVGVGAKVNDWRSQLRFDPIPILVSSGNRAIEYFVKRDLLEEKVEPVETLWHIPAALRIVQRQREDGSWRYPGKMRVVYPRHHYSLVETWKQFRFLVEKYGFSKEHLGGSKAAEFLFSCQTEEGDIRGFIGNQYATYYTGAVMALLIRAGYGDDPRIEKGFRWLISMRQDDGGWTVPILTHRFDRRTMNMLTSQYVEPVEPDRSKPFSHNWTDMVLRAFAVHPIYRMSKEAKIAGKLLKTRFFKPDAYSSYKAAKYWLRFLFWWPNLITTLDSLSLIGFSRDDPDIEEVLDWFIDHQEPNGLWKVTYVKGGETVGSERNKERQLWVSLAISRIFKRLYG